MAFVRAIVAVVVPAQLLAQAAVGPNLRTIPGLHNEPWVAVSLTNPDIVIAAAQQGDISPTAPLRLSGDLRQRFTWVNGSADAVVTEFPSAPAHEWPRTPPPRVCD